MSASSDAGHSHEPTDACVEEIDLSIEKLESRIALDNIEGGSCYQPCGESPFTVCGTCPFGCMPCR